MDGSYGNKLALLERRMQTGYESTWTVDFWQFLSDGTSF
jgi:hypothetical protein